jgi:hypothetical protein
MKKYIYIFAIAAAVMACQKEKTNLEQELPVQGNKVEFTATVESAAAKASVTSATEFTWDATDKAALYTTKGVKLELTISNIIGAKATFTAIVPDEDSIDEGALVVYPASLLTANGKVTFPTSYTNGKGADGPALVAKVSSARTLAFKYMAGTIKFTIADVPAIATSIDVKTSTVADADVVCTGTYTLDFSGENPSLTDLADAGSSVSISGLVAGSNTISMPLPSIGDQKVVVSVKYNENTLFTKKVTLSDGNAVTRNFYAAMPALNINPEVYIVGDRIGWDATASTLVTPEVGFVCERDSFTVLGQRCFRAKVKYGELVVDYGFASADENGEAGGTFVPGGEKAAYLPYSGVYNIGFNYLTGAYTVNKTAISPLYMIGVNNDWGTFDSSTNPFTVIPNTNLMYWKGTSTYEAPNENKTQYKVYECGITSWNESQLPYIYGSEGDGYWWNGAIMASNLLDCKNCGSGDGTEGCAVFDFRGNTHAYGKTAEGATSVVLRGVGGDWSTGISLTKLAGSSRIWHLNQTFDEQHQVKFVENGSTWYGDGQNMGTTPDCANLTNGTNMILPAGTYDIYYIDSDHSYHIYAR